MSIQSYQSKKDFSIMVYYNMVLFLTGKFVSLIGTNVYSYAVSLYVLQVTGSASSFSLTLALGTLPRVILSPFVGSLSDRFNRKVLVVMMDILSGVLLIMIFMLSFEQGIKLKYIYISTFFLTVLNTFFSISLSASVPNIVDKRRLIKLNSYNQSISSLCSISGPVLGGIVYSVLSLEYFILFNGISFIISGFTECFINFNLNNIKDNTSNRINEGNILASINEGFCYLKSAKSIYTLMKYLLLTNFFFSSFFIAYPHIVNNILQLSEKQYGLIQGFLAVGSLIFSIVMARLSEISNKIKLLITCFWMLGILIFISGLPSVPALSIFSKNVYLIFYITITFITGGILSITNIPIISVLQSKTTDEYRGRIFGIVDMISSGITPLGFVLNGILIDILPCYLITAVAGMLFFIVTFFMYRNEELRKI